MILIDTSIWIEHLRYGDPILVGLLNAGRVLTHPFVIGEIALGILRHRERVIDLLSDLPSATPANNEEILSFISTQGLYGRGIGYVDAHLLAATQLTAGASLWTKDRRLAQTATELGISARFD